MGEERRRFKRVPAGNVVWYEIQDTGRMQSGLDQGDVELGTPMKGVDISMGGVQVQTNHKFGPEKQLKLIISLRPTDPPITILARVVWVREDKLPGNFVMGFEFLEFLNQRQDLLQKYIDSFEDNQ